MLIYNGGGYNIGTPEGKQDLQQQYTPTREAEHHEEREIRQTGSSSTSTRVRVRRTAKPSFYLIIVNVEVGYDPSSSETIVIAVYKGDNLIGCFNSTFYPSSGIWHVAKNVRKFSIPIIASSEITSSEFSVKIYDTSGNEKSVNYIELTTEVRGVA